MTGFLPRILVWPFIGRMHTLCGLTTCCATMYLEAKCKKRITVHQSNTAGQTKLEIRKSGKWELQIENWNSVCSCQGQVSDHFIICHKKVARQVRNACHRSSEFRYKSRQQPFLRNYRYLDIINLTETVLINSRFYWILALIHAKYKKHFDFQTFFSFPAQSVCSLFCIFN